MFFWEMRHPFCNLSAFLGQVGLVLSTIRISAQKSHFGASCDTCTDQNWLVHLVSRRRCLFSNQNSPKSGESVSSYHQQLISNNQSSQDLRMIKLHFLLTFIMIQLLFRVKLLNFDMNHGSARRSLLLSGSERGSQFPEITSNSTEFWKNKIGIF